MSTRHSAAGCPTRRIRRARPRLLRPHQGARHHADRDDRVGWRIFCRRQVGRFVAVVDAAARADRHRPGQRRHCCHQRSGGARPRCADAPHLAASAGHRQHEPAARVGGRLRHDHRRRALSVGNDQLAHRRAGGAYLDQLSHGVHADEARASHLHVSRRVSRSHASGAGLDRRFAAASTAKPWSCSPFCSSGSSRISIPSRGSTARTTRTRASACCPSSRATAAPPRSPS